MGVSLHFSWIYFNIDTPIFSHRQTHIVAIATLTGAAELACGQAFSSKVYAQVEREFIEAACRLRVKLRPTADHLALPLWSESGSGRKVVAP